MILGVAIPSGGELFIVLAIVVLFFGASKLPGLARSLGQAQSEFRKGTAESVEEETTSAKGDKPAN